LFSQEIIRSHSSFKIPIVTIGEASKEELRTLFRDVADIEVEDRWIDAYAESSGFSAEYFLERAEAVRHMSAGLWKEGQPALIETSEELVLHIPPKLVRKNKELKVTQIRAEIAMYFSYIYDDLPPLCQMVLKIVTIATRRGFYKVPYEILWNAMNDLIAQGVAKKDLDKLVEEMVDLHVIKIEDRDERTVGFALDHYGDQENHRVFSVQSPALADIAMDVCTPIQVRSIASALIDRLGVKTDVFQVSLVVAGLHSLLNHEEGTMIKLWRISYHNFLRKSKAWPQHRINKWKEIIDDEITDSGHSPQAILGDNFSVPVAPRRLIAPCISMLKLYCTPIALGPMSLSLAVICRNTFLEYGTFHSGNSVDVTKLRQSTNSASGRYMIEMSVLERYLQENGVSAPLDELEAEMEMISFFANPADSPGGVETKAVLLLEEVIPRFVEHRLRRLYDLVLMLKESKETPTVLISSQRAIRLAYEALQSDKSRIDAAQDAFMILATMNWTPKPIPEYLPLVHQQTVPNIRNATMTRLNDVEIAMCRHQQSVDDLEAFLIVTPLLQYASDYELC
jgi:hypothetical protein